MQETQNETSPATIFSLFLDGRFMTTEQFGTS
ncbi:YoaP domain-containing protein [Flagellimonas marinaquae]